MPAKDDPRRRELLAEIRQLAGEAIFGSLSETYRTCGQRACRCHGDGPKHGPHLYVSYRGERGKTTAYYVPAPAQEDIRRGAAAWARLQEALRELADLNKERYLAKAKAAAEAKKAFRNRL